MRRFAAFVAALYLAPDPGELAFITLSDRQREIATAPRFAT